MTDRLKSLANDRIVGNIKPYSSFVKFLRVAMPLTALSIILIVFLWPQFSQMDIIPLTKTDINALKDAETKNTLKTPVFHTQDKNGNPFSIKAKQATQIRSDSNNVNLSEPFATMHNDDDIITIESIDGAYDQNAKIIQLNEDVKVKDSDNNILETQSLTVDIEHGIAHSNAPATLTTDQGVISGKSVTINNITQKTIFQGPAKAVIKQ